MTAATNGRILEENLREAMDLSRALLILMVGVIEDGYPHAIEKRDLTAIYELVSEISDRTAEANHQWHEEAGSPT